ncbi:MAG TPA: PKD domain-containing protein [Thermoanaerobaculia bacterium]|jgi:hypothetical protein
MTSPRSRTGKALTLALLLLAAALAASAWWVRGHKDTVRAALRALKPGTDARPAVAAGPEVSSPEYARLGDGFLVWESDRTGPWRIWTRRLDGSGLRQLTAEEPGHEHCCSHISPDGKQVAYLSLSNFKYGADPEAGELHLIGPDGKGDRVVAPKAQTYSRGHRAAIWDSDTKLQFIDGDGNTLVLDLATSKTEKIASPSSEGHGWLVNRTRTHATTGLPTFSLYDAARRAVTERTPYGGCEPYFSDDGRWGIWMAGAGGPMRALDLATRTPKALFEKNDPRLGAQAYMYFPMLSNGSSLLAFGASPNEHDHEKGNYDIFVVEVDPNTLDVLGQPLKYTSAPTPDRYPDVHVEPLPLGRTFGEAPFRVHLQDARLGPDAVWDFGDGTPAGTSNGEHTYEKPGSFAVTARAAGQGGVLLRGRATILPAQPPHALKAELRQGREIRVELDEPVSPAPGGVKARLASGRAITGIAVAADGRSLTVSLAQEQTTGDHLHLEGVVDRAQRPNALAPVDLAVPPASWPTDRKSLVLLWDTADQPNLVPDPAQAADRAYTIAPHGRARLDHDHAMLLVGDGAFQAEAEAGKNLVELVKKSNELTLELTLTPAVVTPQTSAVILSFGRFKGEPLLQLEQQGDALLWRLLRDHSGGEPVRFGKLQAGRPVHVALGYSPGRQVVWLDGAPALDGGAWQGDFFAWQPGSLSVGASGIGDDNERPWRGVVEGLALYDRLLGADEVAENARRYAAERARRPAVPRTQVTATLQRCSRVPSLDEIAPYRQALAVCQYRVDRAPAGIAAGSTVRVARWVILDGETLKTPPGAPVPLTLEPFNANGQLESIYLSNDLPKDPGTASPLYYDPTSG